MTTREEQQIRATLNAHYDRLPLPESLAARLPAPPDAVTGAPTTDDPLTNQPPSRQRWLGWPIGTGLIAAAVAGIVITTSALNAHHSPSASSPTANQSAAATTSQELASSEPATAGRVFGLPIECGQTWTDPTATMPVSVQPQWPNRLSSKSWTELTVALTNTGTQLITGEDSWSVIILRNDIVVGRIADTRLMRRPPVTLEPGTASERTVQVPRAGTCDPDNPQPLEDGTYQVVFLETIVGDFAYSQPVTMPIDGN